MKSCIILLSLRLNLIDRLCCLLEGTYSSRSRRKLQGASFKKSEDDIVETMNKISSYYNL